MEGPIPLFSQETSRRPSSANRPGTQPHRSPNPRASAEAPGAGGFFNITKPDRCKWSTSLLATMSAMISSAL